MLPPIVGAGFILRKAALVAVCVSLLVRSCSGDGLTASDTPDGLYITLDWVGTEVLYRPVEGKHDLSLLFILSASCGWCQKLKNETPADPDVVQILGESFNIARIDFAVDTAVFWEDLTVSSRYLAGQVYGVGSVPTTIVLDYEGVEIRRIVGYKEPDTFAGILEEIRPGRQSAVRPTRLDGPPSRP